MSSSTALLPKDRQRDEHPIFLRVCHSPWLRIGQKSLSGLRALVAFYLVAVSAMIIRYEIKNTEHKYLAFFELINIAWFLLTLYHIIAFTWTFMHLHYPHLSGQNQTFKTRVQTFFSPPRQNPNTGNRTWFSIYYMAVNTLPWLAALVYWAILAPKNKVTIPSDELLGRGWFQTFILVNRFFVAPLITFLETFFFSSIKRPTPVFGHILGLSFLISCYFGWVYLGYVVLDKCALSYFDYREVGWEHALGAWAVMNFAEILWFWIIYGLIALREFCTKRGERSSSGGYQQLPQ